MLRSRKVPIKLERRRLDRAGIEAHIDELSQDAEAIEIRVKGSSTQYSSASAQELRDVGRQLLAGDVEAVQIRFYRGGDWWCDTLLRAREDFRLVRMNQTAT